MTKELNKLKASGHLKEDCELSSFLSMYRETDREDKDRIIKELLVSDYAMKVVKRAFDITACDKDLNEMITSIERGVYCNTSRRGNDGISKCGTVSYEYKQQMLKSDKKFTIKITFDRLSIPNYEKFKSSKPVLILTVMDYENVEKVLELTLNFDDILLELYRNRVENKSKASGTAILLHEIKDSIKSIDYVSNRIGEYNLENGLVDLLRQNGYDAQYKGKRGHAHIRDTIFKTIGDRIKLALENGATYTAVAKIISDNSPLNSKTLSASVSSFSKGNYKFTTVV